MLSGVNKIAIHDNAYTKAEVSRVPSRNQSKALSVGLGANKNNSHVRAVGRKQNKIRIYIVT